MKPTQEEQEETAAASSSPSSSPSPSSSSSSSSAVTVGAEETIGVRDGGFFIAIYAPGYLKERNTILKANRICDQDPITPPTYNQYIRDGAQPWNACLSAENLFQYVVRKHGPDLTARLNQILENTLVEISDLSKEVAQQWILAWYPEHKQGSFLHYAAQHKKQVGFVAKIIKILSEEQLKKELGRPDGLDGKGWSPLDYAMQRQSVRTLVLFIKVLGGQSLADPLTQNSAEKYPKYLSLHCAAGASEEEEIAAVKEMLAALKNCKMPQEAGSNEGVTQPAKEGSLLQSKLQETDNQGRTPLEHALQDGCFKTAILFILAQETPLTKKQQSACLSGDNRRDLFTALQDMKEYWGVPSELKSIIEKDNNLGDIFRKGNISGLTQIWKTDTIKKIQAQINGLLKTQKDEEAEQEQGEQGESGLKMNT